MPFTLPTAEAFKTRFPEFAEVADARIEAIIGEARSFVDETWIPADFAPAIRFLAAHMLAMEGANSDAPATVATTGPVQMVKVGDVSTEFSRPGGASMAGGDTAAMSDRWLNETAYGVRFLALRRRSFPAIHAV